MDIRQPEMPALKLEGEPRVIDSQTMKHGRVQIVDMDGIPNDIISEIIGLTEHHPGADPASAIPLVKQRG